MSVAVIGYASLDYAVRLDRPSRLDRTATILSRPSDWPRVGGSAAYVCAALAACGVRDALPISWIGDDAEGARYRDGVRRLGVSDEGITTRRGQSPVCILAYEPGGGCHCFYDPGLHKPLELDARQAALIAAADTLCVTIGPPEATRAALALARPEAALIWAVKADPRAAPPDIAAALVARADAVVFNRGEAPFVDEAFAAAAAAPRRAIRIETRGRDGVAVAEGGVTHVLPVDPVEVEDTTGAGDTMVGGFIAARTKGADAVSAAKAGVETARAFLLARAGTEAPD